MHNYQIIGLVNHNITLAFDGKRINFPLPIVEGKYPEGAALATLLSAYVKNVRVAQQPVMVASNLSSIQSLITPPTEDETKAKIRIVRTRLLALTEWTQGRDSPLSAVIIQAWGDYRQALRDMTAQRGFPNEVTWPVPPFAITNPAGVVITDALGVPAMFLRVG